MFYCYNIKSFVKKGVFIMKPISSNNEDLQKKNDVLFVLARLYYNKRSISWNQVLSIAGFLYRNQEFGPKETKDIAKYLVRINHCLTEQIACHYFNLLVRERMIQEFSSLSSVDEKKLQHERILESLSFDSSNENENQDECVIPFLIRHPNGETLGFMGGDECYPLFDRVTYLYGKMQEIIDESEICDSEVFHMFERLTELRNQMEAAISRTDVEEKREFLQNYVCKIDSALLTLDMEEMEHILNGVIVRKKEKKELKN